MHGDAGDVVLDASFKGIPYGTRTRLADIASRGWNVAAGDLSLPVMTLDRAAVESNIAAMAAYCARHGVRLAPHGKTTMSPQLFRRQLAAGAWAITAATPGQAGLMREAGIQRILLASELVDPNAFRWLAAEYRRDPAFELIFLVDHPAAVRLADEVLTAAGPGRQVPVLIELGLDGPAGRTGVRTAGAAIALAEHVAATATLALAGVETYEGSWPGGGGRHRPRSRRWTSSWPGWPASRGLCTNGAWPAAASFCSAPAAASTSTGSSRRLPRCEPRSRTCRSCCAAAATSRTTLAGTTSCRRWTAVRTAVRNSG